MIMTTIGQAAFAAYKKAVQGVTYDGKPIPDWILLPQAVRSAWEEAAYAVRVYDEAVRNRAEIEQRLERLIHFLATSDWAEEFSVRTHARAMDLVWVLYPALTVEQATDLIKERVSAAAAAQA